MTEELVAVGILTFDMLVAVIVKLPVVLKSTCSVTVPLTSGAGGGKPAATSEDVTPMVLPGAVVTMWKVGSTALIVTLMVPPALRLTGVGVPILPDTVFGALVSPGSRTCSLVKGRLIRAKKLPDPAGNDAAGMSARLSPPCEIKFTFAGALQFVGAKREVPVRRANPLSG